MSISISTPVFLFLRWKFTTAAFTLEKQWSLEVAMLFIVHKWKCCPEGGAKGKLMECPKSRGSVIWGAWMCSKSHDQSPRRIGPKFWEVLTWWWSGVTKTIRTHPLHPLDTMNINSKIHSNLVDFSDLSLWTKMDRWTDRWRQSKILVFKYVH